MSWIYQNQFFIFIGLLFGACAIFGFLLAKSNKKIKLILGNDEIGDGNKQQELLRRITRAEIKLEDIEPRLGNLEAISKISVQKTGFLRFNPFPGTGGDNSFVIAQLDKENNGFLLSSLYAREGVRVYAKKVELGQSKNPLSGEEKKVLEETINK